MTSSISSERSIERTRMPSIVLVGVLFIALGALDVHQGVTPMVRTGSGPATDDLQVLAIGIAALVGGVFVLRGQSWARWLLAGWMLLHVAISVGEMGPLIAHVMIFGFLAYLLFRSGAAAHFS